MICSRKTLVGFLSMFLLITAFQFLSPSKAVYASESQYMWPVPNWTGLSRGYSDAHDGQDILGAYGTPIVASKSGTVVKVLSGDEPDWIGYGNGVVISHGDGYYTHYAHMSSVCVSQGQSVSQGQQIGGMGASGNADGTHLHFAIATRIYGAGGRINNNRDAIAYTYSSLPTSVAWSTYSDKNDIREGKIQPAKTATLSGAVMNNCSSVGINVYNSAGTKVATKSEEPNRSGNTYVYLWYDFVSELNLPITPGTIYKYSMYLVINGKTYTSPTETITCPPTYTVTFDSNGGSSVSSKTVGKNQTINPLPTTSRSNYEFDGWYTAKTGGTKLTTSTTITGNVTYYAHWSLAEDPNTSIAINSTNFPDAVFRQYISSTFDTDKSGYLSETEVSLITSIELDNSNCSSLKGIEFFVNLTSLRAENNKLSSVNLSKNTKLTYLHLMRNELSTIDLSKNTQLMDLYLSYNKLTSIDVSNNTKLRYFWIAYNQISQLDFSKNSSLGDIQIEHNKITTLDISNLSNLAVLYCRDNPVQLIDIRNNAKLVEAYSAHGTSMDTGGYRYAAHQFSYILCVDVDDIIISGTEVFSITCSEVNNGTVSLSKTSANYGDEITVTTAPATGYQLETIKVNGTAISGNKFTMPAKNTTVAVTFKKVNYTVSLSDVSNGTASLSKTTANYGDEITVTTNPSSGYKLESIKVNGTAITGNAFTMPAKNTTVAVTFAKVDYTITLSSVSNGTVTLSQSSANVGDEITVNATPATGYELGSIKVNGTAISGNKFTMPAKNTTVEVIFAKKVHTLTKVAAKAPTCTADGTITYYICKDDTCGCNKIYSDAAGENEITLADIVVKATGHTLEKVSAKEATCTEAGHLAYWKCTNCGKLFKDAAGEFEITAANVTVDPLGHDTEHVEHIKKKDSTYKEDGHEDYYLCPQCGKKFSDPDCKNPVTDAELLIPKKGAAVLGEEATVGDFNYRVTYQATDGNGTVTLIGVDNKTASVVIPSNVEIKGNIYKVNRIGTKAFYGDKTVKTVYIGNNVVIIDAYAFYGCSNLVKVSGGKVLKTIGSKAFAYCSKLKSFSISSAVLNKIGAYAFQKDKKLKTVYIKYTTKLTKSGVKKSLKSSSVKTVKVKKSKVKKYKKYFTKKNAGRKVKVKK